MKRLPVQNRRLPDHRGLECRDAEEFQTLPDHLEVKYYAMLCAFARSFVSLEAALDLT